MPAERRWKRGWRTRSDLRYIESHAKDESFIWYTSGAGLGRPGRTTMRRAAPLGRYASHPQKPSVTFTLRTPSIERTPRCEQADPAPARTPPLRGRRHPARQDGRLGVQGIHLRHAVPEALLRRVRGRAREQVIARAARRRARRRPRPRSAPSSSDFYGQSFYVPPQRALGLPAQRGPRQRRRRPEQGARRRWRAATQPRRRAASTSTSTARSARRKIPDKKLRELIMPLQQGTGCATRTSSSPTCSAPPTST